MLDLCDIMNAEFREMADSGCPLIQVEEPPHHSRSLRPDCTEEELNFLTEAFNGQPQLLLDAVPWMFRIRDDMERLIKNPVPGRPGVHAGPTFEVAEFERGTS